MPKRKGSKENGKSLRKGTRWSWQSHGSTATGHCRSARSPTDHVGRWMRGSAASLGGAAVRGAQREVGGGNAVHKPEALKREEPEEGGLSGGHAQSVVDAVSHTRMPRPPRGTRQGDTSETRQTMNDRSEGDQVADRPATPAETSTRAPGGPGHDPRAATGTGIGSDPARITAPAGTDPCWRPRKCPGLPRGHRPRARRRSPEWPRPAQRHRDRPLRHVHTARIRGRPLVRRHLHRIGPGVDGAAAVTPSGTPGSTTATRVSPAAVRAASGNTVRAALRRSAVPHRP